MRDGRLGAITPQAWRDEPFQTAAPFQKQLVDTTGSLDLHSHPTPTPTSVSLSLSLSPFFNRCFLYFFSLVLMRTRAGHLTPFFIGSMELTFRTRRERASINTQRSQESVFIYFHQQPIWARKHNANFDDPQVNCKKGM